MSVEPPEEPDDGEIRLIGDGDGLAIIGDLAAVERFRESEGLRSNDFGLLRLRHIFGSGAAGAQAWSDISANSDRWDTLPTEGAERAKRWGPSTTDTRMPGGHRSSASACAALDASVSGGDRTPPPNRPAVRRHERAACNRMRQLGPRA